MFRAETSASLHLNRARNLSLDPSTIDLHNLSVTNALQVFIEFLQERRITLQAARRSSGRAKYLLMFIFHSKLFIVTDCETKLSGSASPVGVTLIACQD